MRVLLSRGKAYRTVGGKSQDGLVTELRLAEAETIEHANEGLHRYLPKFDNRFGVPAE